MKKIEAQEGLKVLENALHESAKSVEIQHISDCSGRLILRFSHLKVIFAI
jgi:hypothetical protein